MAGIELYLWFGLCYRDEVSISIGLYPYSLRSILNVLLESDGKVWVGIIICCLSLL